MHGFEQRSLLEEQKSKRVEQENRAWIEKSLQLIKEEFIGSKKRELQGEKNLLNDFSESLGKLTQMIRNTKENLEAKLNASQTHYEEGLKGM